MAAKRSSVMMWTAWLIIVAVIVLDQVVKVWVKTHMYLGEDISILPWFHICFVQNNGMAFGLEILNKFILTFLRIGLFGFLCWYIARLSRNAWVPMTYLASIALIAAADHHCPAALGGNGIQIIGQGRAPGMIPVAGSQPETENYRSLEQLGKQIAVPHPQHDVCLLICGNTGRNHIKIPQELL